MKKKRRNLIVIGIVLFLGLFYGVFLRKKITFEQCKIHFADRSLVLLWERPGLKGWTDGYVGKVRIESRSGPLGLRSDLLVEGEVGGGLLENEPCVHFQQNGNDLLILSQFYSSDRGKTFVSLADFRERHQDASAHRLRVAYPELRPEGLRIAYSLHQPGQDSVIFFSRDGGQSWESETAQDF